MGLYAGRTALEIAVYATYVPLTYDAFHFTFVLSFPLPKFSRPKKRRWKTAIEFIALTTPFKFPATLGTGHTWATPILRRGLS